MKIIERMHKVMLDVHGVEKGSFNPQARYKYTSHEELTAVLAKAYRRHGIVRTASVKSFTRHADELSMLVDVTWHSAADEHDSYSVTSLGECGPLTKSGKLTPQQSGIAFSYAVKAAEFKAFSLTGDDTPDGDESGDDDGPVGIILDRFASARTAADVDAIEDDVRAGWAEYKHAKAEIAAASKAARERVG